MTFLHHVYIYYSSYGSFHVLRHKLNHAGVSHESDIQWDLTAFSSSAQI